ncbi:hypothetical protein [Azospirillum argentinense]
MPSWEGGGPSGRNYGGCLPEARAPCTVVIWKSPAHRAQLLKRPQKKAPSRCPGKGPFPLEGH